MEESGNNWDLQAVVRGYRVMAKDPFSSFLPLLPPAHKEEEVEVGGDAWCFPNLMMESKSGLEELEELYKPFLPKTQQPSPSSTTTAAAAVAVAPKLGPQPQQNRQPNRQISQVPRSKRRKNQQKKVVCHVPADGVSSDMWAWRKYGQKPIKGSPYPRGYYRCSSSKGCLARKQVERSRTDPAMFIITYTAEHNHPVPTHRNSLAGSTRNKSQTPTTTTSGGAASASASGGDEENPPPRKAGLSPTTPLAAPWRQKGEEGEEEDEADDEEEEEGMLLVEDMEVMGEDELLFMDGGGGEEANGTSSSSATATATIPAAAQVALSGFFDYEAGLEEPFFNPPWMANSNNNTAAAAGGS